jgi:ABC-2 type transport system ATP-binding protein
MQPVIEAVGLTKYYGNDLGLLDLDLEVRPGEVFGYLGPNGAGKTTTIRLLLDLIRPTRGNASVFGLDVASGDLDIRRRIGYLPGELSLYDKLTAREIFGYFSRLRSDGGITYAEELAAALDLSIDRPVRDLSKGNKQKVGLVQAMMHRPELLILDEPTSGLDPIVQRTVHSLLDDARSEGRTVFLSSHVLHEVEEIADRIAIIRAGHLVAVEKISDLKRKAVREVDVHFASEIPADSFALVPNLHSVEVDGARARLRVEGEMDPLIKTLARFEVTSLTAQEADLEEVFFAYYEGDGS